MQVINRKGEVFNVDGDVVPDGCSLRTNIFMLDSGLDDTQREIARSFSRPALVVDAIGRACGNRPGFLLMDTSTMRDAAEAARATRKKLLADAWRTPMSDALNEQGGAWEPTRTPDLVPFKPTPDADAAGNLSAAYLAEKQRVSNAWRSPAGASINPAEPKARMFERNFAASYAPYMEHDAATDGVDARDAAFAALVARSESAWRTP
jgi:hypothetical protein